MQSMGSQSWVVAFVIQSLIASNLIAEIGLTLKKGHDFIKKSQVSMLYYIYVHVSNFSV